MHIFFSTKFLLTFVIFAVIIFIFTNISLIKTAYGATITTPTTTFYIPADSPTKVYMFDRNPQELQQILEQSTKGFPGTLGIYIKNLSTGQESSINPDQKFVAASLYKLSVMYTIFDLASKGKLDLEKPDIKNNLNSMITVSSNTAAISLVQNYTSWSEVTKKMHEIGLNSTSLNQDPTITTPRDTGKLLELISLGKAVDMDSSIKMLDLLSAQKRNDRIPVLLPPEVIVAHKTGELGDARHDAGVLVGPDNNIVMVLMSDGSTSPESVKPTMSKLSNDIYQFFKSQWANPPEIL